MTGTDIIAGLLLGAAAVTDRVPAAQIKGGALPDDAKMPSLLIRSISEVERLKLRRSGFVLFTERVEVSVRAASYREAREIRGLVRDACAGKIGQVEGCRVTAVLNAGAGPELAGPNNSFERSQDFRVSFETPA